MRRYNLIPLVVILFLVFGQNVYSQNRVDPSTVDVNSLNDSQIQRIIKEIQTRGLTNEQAIELAKAQGANQSQIDQLMTRVQQFQSTAPTKAVQTATAKPSSTLPNSSYTSIKVSGIVSERTKKIFGYQLFNSERLTFEPGVNVPIPQSYILGVGDQLSINVWGASQMVYQPTLDNSGAITLPDVGPIFLSGLPFEKAKSLIQTRLMTIYNGMSGDHPNTWSEVSMGSIHSIKINLLGELNAPGTYTLPATASAFNALYLSGGPNENGSFREIKLIRDGVTIKTIDIYDFLVNADPSSNVQLREQDILFVPNYNAHVEIAGEVKQKGIFEVKKGETINDLIRFAGGFSGEAYTNSLSVLRNTDRERELRTVDNVDFGKVSLQNGDLIRIANILNRFSNRVAIAGAVFHPGDFELTPGMKLSELIRKADGLREEAFLNRGLISRLKEDHSPDNITFDLKQVIDGSRDILLQKEDSVFISSISQLQEARTISITGQVLNPQVFDYKDNLTLGDLIFKAGGFREEADPSLIEVSRRLSYEQASKATDKLNNIFQFTLSRDLKLSPADAAFQLQPFDEVFVRRAPGYRNQGTFFVSGEVLFEGSFSIIEKNERISDAIKRAGGLNPGAFIQGATLKRMSNLSAAELEKRMHLIKTDPKIKDSTLFKGVSYSVGIKLDKILANPGTSSDLLLYPGDLINIPRELQTVKVSGNVMNPLALTFNKRLSLQRYINMAGGYAYQSSKSKVYVLYPNGTMETTKGLIFRRSPRILPGSEIIVPKKPEKKQNDDTLKWVSLSAGLGSLSITIITLLKLL
jgi:protein involved in polysaccharide export with SLBB domain